MATLEERQQVLGELNKKHGYVKPSMVVRAAKPKNSPIHSDFEWDDAVAAREHRLAKARQVIRITPIVTESGADKIFVHVPAEPVEGPTARVTDREGQYKTIDVVVASPSEFRACLQQLVTQRTAMDESIRQLKRAAKKTAHGKHEGLLVQLHDAMNVVKNTLRLLLKEA